MARLTFLMCLLVSPTVARADTVAFWRFGEKPAGEEAEAQGPIRDASGFGNHGRLGEPEPILFGGHDEPLVDPGMLKVVDWSKEHRKCLVFREQGYGLLYIAPNRGTAEQPAYEDITPWVTRGGPLTTGIFTIPKVADWDGDGLADLLLGSQSGYVHFCRNLGRKGDLPQFATPVMLRAAGRLIQPRTMSGMTDVTFGVHFCYTNPEAADGDGDLDLLLGWQGATLLFYENIGSRTEPKLAAAVEVRRQGKPVFAGARSRPAAVDFNRDGLIDLIAPDIEGYLVFHQRDRKEGRLLLREPVRLTNRTRGHVLIDMRLPAKRFAGKTITSGTWLHAGIKDVAGVQILDFVQGRHEVSSGEGHPGDGQWRFVTVTRSIRTDATGEVVLRLSAQVPFVKKVQKR